MTQPTAGLTFEQALIHAKEDKNIRRKAWCDSFQDFTMNKLVPLSKEDYNANDWMVAQPPKFLSEIKTGNKFIYNDIEFVRVESLNMSIDGKAIAAKRLDNISELVYLFDASKQVRPLD